VWWAVPVKPRAILRLPAFTNLLGLGPGGTVALVERYLPVPEGDNRIPLALDLVDTSTGESITTLLDHTWHVKVIDKSVDGDTWLLDERDDVAGTQVLRLDLAARTVEPLALGHLAPERLSGSRLSCDGRLAAFFEPTSSALILWDVARNQQLATLPGLRPPYAFAADGRSMAAAYTSTVREEVGVLDLETLKLRATLDLPWGERIRVGSVCLSDDGSRAAAHLTGSQIVCWDVATREARLNVQQVALVWDPFDHDRLRFAGGGRVLIALPHPRSGGYVWCYDVDRRVSWADRFVEFGQRWDMSPDGRFLLAHVKESHEGWSKRLARSVGITQALWFGTETRGRLYEAASGRELASIPGEKRDFLEDDTEWVDMTQVWTSDGRLLAVRDRTDPTTWYCWDLPPRKPLVWPLVGVTLLTLTVALSTRWRVRQLRRAVSKSLPS
jgi:hypothetical protein